MNLDVLRSALTTVNFTRLGFGWTVYSWWRNFFMQYGDLILLPEFNCAWCNSLVVDSVQGYDIDVGNIKKQENYTSLTSMTRDNVNLRSMLNGYHENIFLESVIFTFVALNRNLEKRRKILRGLKIINVVQGKKFCESCFLFK